MDKRIKLDDLCNQVESKMREMGCTDDSIGRYRRAWWELKQFYKTEYYDEEISARFLKNCCAVELEHECTKLNKSQMYLVRAVRTLSDYHRFGDFKRKGHPFAITWPASFGEPIKDFLSAPENAGKSPDRYQRMESQIQMLVQYLDRAGIGSFMEVEPAHITGFTATLTGYAPRTIATALSCMRVFFEYLYKKQFIKEYIPSAIPKFRYAVRLHLPTIWTQEDINKIMACIDRGNPVGKRNYAMILLAARLGLRVCDIRALKLSDIKWEKGTLEIRQSKTGKPLSLPLLDEVGWAIIEYLKDGRPITDSEHVFVRHLAPFVALCNHNALHSVIASCVKKADIPPERSTRIGIRSLRHSLATELLQQNVPLPTISGILGHAKSESTRHYLKVDTDGLRQCALREEVLSIG